METLFVERLDHLGVVAGVIKDLGISTMIDARIPPDEREEITTGEAVAGMILNGLGFFSRPLSLTPQFFEKKPLDLLFREGVCFQHFNRFKLGRSLDKVYAYGCNLLFSEISLAVCQKEGIDLRFNSLDTTSFSLTGEYDSSTDEEAILVTYGYSKDHRPDLKQVILELMVSQDGGVPFLSQSWNGNANDNQIFFLRSQALIEEFKASPKPRYLVADAKLYTQENAKNLALFPFITRIPGTLAIEQQVIDQAWSIDSWQPLVEMAVADESGTRGNLSSSRGTPPFRLPTVSDTTYSYQRLWLCHYGIQQRWLIIYSKAAEKRAEKTLKKAVTKEFSSVQKQLKKLAKKPFSSPSLAGAALEEIASKWVYHRVVESTISEKRKYAKRGKPKADTPIKSRTWHIATVSAKDEEKIEKQRRQKACFVLGSNIAENELTDIEIFSGYKGQSAIEQGFSFLKDPVFFVSSLFVKKPERIQGLLMVMTLALLVYSIAQRRARKSLMAYGELIPNQIGQPTQTPTLRWLFQLLEGIHRVTFSVEGKVRQVIEGLTDLRQKILRLFSESVIKIYYLSLSASSP